LYQDQAARFLSDADLLIPSKDAIKSVDLMLELGWTYVNAYNEHFKKLGTEVLSRVLKEVTLKNDKQTEIDIHWRLFDVDLDMASHKKISQKKSDIKRLNDKLWSRSVPFDFGTTACRTLCTEDLFLHVIVHGAAGNPHRTMRWVADAIHILRRLPIDWPQIMQRAREFNYLFTMQVALTYLHNHFPAEIPKEVLDLIMHEPVSKEEIRTYYKSANTTVRFGRFGNFPLLWNAYWEIKKEKNIKLPGLFEYLRSAWGLPRKRDIIGFVTQKYATRILRKLNPNKR
jgi:hypothetical protein